MFCQNIAVMSKWSFVDSTKEVYARILCPIKNQSLLSVITIMIIYLLVFAIIQQLTQKRVLRLANDNPISFVMQKKLSLRNIWTFHVVLQILICSRSAEIQDVHFVINNENKWMLIFYIRCTLLIIIEV